MGDARALSNAIAQLLANPAQASQLALRAYSVVRNRFTAESNARQIEAVYEEIVGIR
jgi:glycosyltransferase involved in cell wall biosynthesis